MSRGGSRWLPGVTMGTATKIQHPGGGSEGLPRASPCPDQARGRDGCEALGTRRSCRRAGPGLPAARGWASSWASAAAGLQSWADRNPACVVVCVFFSFFTFWFIVGNVGDRGGVSKAIADLAEPSKLLKPCRMLSGGVQVWRRACSHPLRTVLFRVGELLGSKQACCYGSITIFFPQDRILEKYWINSHIPRLSSGVRVRSSWVSYAS